MVLMDFYFSLFRSGTRKADNALTLLLKLKICTKRLDFGLAIIKVEIRYTISFFIQLTVFENHAKSHIKYDERRKTRESLFTIQFDEFFRSKKFKWDIFGNFQTL